MISAIKTRVKELLNLYVMRICKSEYEQQSFTRLNERLVELAFVFKHLGRICPRKILDVGTGTTALPHLMRNCGSLVTATDNIRDYWPSSMVNRHYYVINDDIQKLKLMINLTLLLALAFSNISKHLMLL